MAMTQQGISASRAVFELIYKAEELDAANTLMFRTLADILKTNEESESPNDKIKYLAGEVLRKLTHKDYVSSNNPMVM